MSDSVSLNSQLRKFSLFYHVSSLPWPEQHFGVSYPVNGVKFQVIPSILNTSQIVIQLNFSRILDIFIPFHHTKSVKTLGYQRNQCVRRCIVPPTIRAITILIHPMVNAAHLFFIV